VPDQATKPDALVVFMPSGRRGRFPLGTPLLQAARSLGVDIDSVCGGRGICGRCQIEIAEGEFPKLGLTSAADHLSGFGAIEKRYAERRSRSPAALLLLDPALRRCRHRRALGEPGASPGRAQAGRDAQYRARTRGPAPLCRGGRAGHA
jgi:hypothetical protein